MKKKNPYLYQKTKTKKAKTHTYKKHISTAILVHILLYYECAHLQNRDEISSQNKTKSKKKKDPNQKT